MKKFIILLCYLCITCNAELRLASLFQDKMVLQRGQAIPIWGWGNVGEEVVVQFNEQSVKTLVNDKGEWRLDLTACDASLKPLEMRVFSPEGSIHLNDVLIGDVWICSGQSNMAMSVAEVPDVKALAPTSTNIRSFQVEQTVAFEEQNTCNGEWVNTHPDSAVAFSFAYYLQQDTGVPVGIILTAWGSSSIEAWMPRDMVETVPHFKTMIEEFDSNNQTKDKIQTILDGGLPFSRADNVFLRRQTNILYNAMMHPLVPYACKGIVWYQGERNTQSMYGMLSEPWYSRNSGMLKYADTLKSWIQRYREGWESDEFRCMVVMLPGCYKKPLETGARGEADSPVTHSWAWMRESQMKALNLPNTAVVNTIDLGHVTNIHPKDKLPIGQRLSALVERSSTQGPLMKQIASISGQLVVSFNDAKGLQTVDGEAPKGFWITDDSARWVPADATIQGETVVLSSKAVAKPLYVRYAFSGKPDVNLVNDAGLPAYPFRSDTFKPSK